MANLSACIDYVLKNEGGFTLDPDDPGGATNWGIIAADLSKYLARPVTTEDVKSMSRETAVDIYRLQYWQPLKLYSVQSKAVATCLLDVGTLYGIGTCVKYAQIALNNLGADLEPDGHMREPTLDALNSADAKAFIRQMVNLIYDRIDGLIEKNQKLAKFKNGWRARASRLLTLS